MKNKGTIFALVLILVAGLGLYFAYENKDLEGASLPATTNSSAARFTTQRTSTRTEKTKESKSTKAPAEKKATQPAATAATVQGMTGGLAPQTLAPPAQTYPYDYPGIAPAVAGVTGDIYLICVNRDYALPANYSCKRAVCVTVYKEKIELEATAAAQYKKMYYAALKEDCELVPFSGYRETSTQKGNFDKKIENFIKDGYSREQSVVMAAQIINPPGCSEHEAGLAIDITVKGVWNAVDTFQDTKEYAWLMENAQDYGFILRYPKDKEKITQVKYEPWHWRYVGVENAKKIKASGLCLEEYLGLY